MPQCANHRLIILLKL